jgi:hypothetical protein
VLRHARDEEVDDPAAGAPIPAWALVRPDAVDEGALQLLLDGHADVVRRLDGGGAAAEHRATDDLGAACAAFRAQELEDERVVGARVGVLVDHPRRE